jgi:membrane-bound serine protease (ClpP class)
MGNSAGRVRSRHRSHYEQPRNRWIRETRRHAFRVITCFLALWALVIGIIVHAQTEKPVVYVAPIRGEIDNGLAPYVQRVVREAERANAKRLVFPIDTLGGRVDAAIVIRDALLDAKVPTVVFVDRRAISAGALITLAAEDIAMATGATIGAATPVVMGADGQAMDAGEKAISFVRKEFRATAEKRHRPPEICEAMVDADVEIPGIIEKGKLLTLTTEEALRNGIATYRAETLDDVLAHDDLTHAEIRTLELNWAERAVRFLTTPVFSSLLLALGMLGLFIELRTPGFGIPGLVGIVCLGLFFWSHMLLALVGWEELALIVGGFLLLALEVFVIPGFGITGVLGAIAVLTGLGMSLVGAGATIDGVLAAAAQVAIAFALALVGAALFLQFLPRLPFGRQLILESSLSTLESPSEPPKLEKIFPGDLGQTVSALRPAGIAAFSDMRVDAISEGDYIPAGSPVEVIRVEQSHVVVKRAAETGEG